MSAITVSRPEVVTGHTDVICSTSIRHILAVRKSTLLQIDTLIRQLAEISAMTESIGGKTARDAFIKAGCAFAQSSVLVLFAFLVGFGGRV